ncbi:MULTISPECIES: hypothetical protein [Kitasatospora]|uniref:Uncharacterized protein n=1 Tax=Kitasatospora paracochleata TaxID=58354 RepID=A0ABT1IWU0_9ACTN|nr:hypothetical protein [Kitasatospora paracochleata]MCP2309610.1 hypothetical protein [Kitasatospora paracochleata]
MTVPPLVEAAPAPLCGFDRVLVPLTAALAVLARLRRLGRCHGPVALHGDRAAFLIAPGAAELVPELLGWLGWGGLRLPLEAAPPAPYGATAPPERRAGRPTVPGRPAPGEGRPALDLRSPDLLRLLDCLADACLRERLRLPPAR